MFQKDYVLRLIEQLVKTLAIIFQLKKKEQYQEALSIIDQSFQQWLGLNSKLINSFSHKDLIEMLSLNKVLGVTKCIMLAELLKEEGDIYDAQGASGESYQRYLKSLNIFLETLRSGNKMNPQKYYSKIEEILAKLKQYELSNQTHQNLFEYYEKIGEYSKAEDSLFELIEREVGQSRLKLINKGISFYQRLIKKKDCQLIKGNLPREEIEEDLAKLKETKRAFKNDFLGQ